MPLTLVGPIGHDSGFGGAKTPALAAPCTPGNHILVVAYGTAPWSQATDDQGGVYEIIHTIANPGVGTGEPVHFFLRRDVQDGAQAMSFESSSTTIGAACMEINGVLAETQPGGTYQFQGFFNGGIITVPGIADPGFIAGGFNLDNNTTMTAVAPPGLEMVPEAVDWFHGFALPDVPPGDQDLEFTSGGSTTLMDAITLAEGAAGSEQVLFDVDINTMIAGNLKFGTSSQLRAEFGAGAFRGLQFSEDFDT